MNESELYKPIGNWLEAFLIERHPKATIHVHDSSRKVLSALLYDLGLTAKIPRSESYEIMVDITGVIETHSSVELALVECKIHPVSLKDVSQLLGYSLVARPLYSILMSTCSVSKAVWNLLETYNQMDILTYSKHGLIRICEWNTTRNEPNASSIIPHGKHFL